MHFQQTERTAKVLSILPDMVNAELVLGTIQTRQDPTAPQKWFEFLATLRLLEVLWFYACFCADSISIGTFARMLSTGSGTPTCMSGSECSFELSRFVG